MMFSELQTLTDNQCTYEEFETIESLYMAKESMTKQQAAKLWKRRYNHSKNMKPLQAELKSIKEAIKDFQDNREYCEYQEKEIAKRYNEQIAEYDENSYFDQSVINSLKEQREKAIYNIYDDCGMDAMIHIIYEDGTECIASGIEIITGDIKPKLQHIVYATYEDGYTEYDTLTGDLLDKFGDLSEDEGIEAREEYFNNVEIQFNTKWGIAHKDLQTA